VTALQDQLSTVNVVPAAFQMGKNGLGGLTVKQKCDLAMWVRLREQSNRPIVRQEMFQAILKFIMINKGLCWPQDLLIT